MIGCTTNKGKVKTKGVDENKRIHGKLAGGLSTTTPTHLTVLVLTGDISRRNRRHSLRFMVTRGYSDTCL